MNRTWVVAFVVAFVFFYAISAGQIASPWHRVGASAVFGLWPACWAAVASFVDHRWPGGTS